jgi:hypothetical protein
MRAPVKETMSREHVDTLAREQAARLDADAEPRRRHRRGRWLPPGR